ncbi:Amino acid permease/ SLC12A domain-containing protein [Plasmodiophora brassicae]|uniref:Amino acid permease/ SLC12A domain-containing protein n=1 Tax=Plasmodiophora brassicae TaxID=37360 RepID=A0A0G4IXJ5_PLABS|nr:hypothetical protein PBRA_007573 [Plasmodiophora brassicae]
MAGDGSDDRLKGNLGTFSGMCLVMGLMIGSGIFSTPGKVVALVGSPTTAISLWVAGGLLTFCGTFSYIELGTMMPRSGGEQAYLEAAFRRPRALVAFLFCWVMILCIRPGSEAADCIIFAKYVVVPFLGDADHDGFREKCLAVVAITSITLVNMAATRLAVVVHDVLTCIKIAVVTLIALTGVLVAAGAIAITDTPANFSTGFHGSASNVSNYASATFLVMWAYDGWNNLSYSAGELGDPVRQLPRATALGVLFATCLYVLANFAYFMVVPLADLVASSELLAGTFFNVVFGGVMGAHVFPMLLALSAYGAVSAMVFSAGRVAQAAALAGVLPYSAYFRHLHAATGTPVRALALNWLLTVALIVSPPSRNAFDFLVDLVSYPEWVFYGLSVVGLIVLRYTGGDVHRPFKVPTVLPVLFIAAALFLVVFPFFPTTNPAYPSWLPPVISLAIIATAVPVWFAFVKDNEMADLGFALEPSKAIADDNSSSIMMA